MSPPPIAADNQHTRTATTSDGSNGNGGSNGESYHNGGLQEVVRNPIQSRKELLAGTWSYEGARATGRSFQIDQGLNFRQHDLTGRLVMDGEWYVAGLKTASGENHGMIRVKPEGGKIMTNFRMHLFEPWGDTITSVKDPDRHMFAGDEFSAPTKASIPQDMMPRMETFLKKGHPATQAHMSSTLARSATEMSATSQLAVDTLAAQKADKDAIVQNARMEAQEEAWALNASVEEDIEFAQMGQDVELDAAQQNKTAIIRQRRRLRRHIVMMEETRKQGLLAHYFAPGKLCPTFYHAYLAIVEWISTFTIVRFLQKHHFRRCIVNLVESQPFEVLTLSVILGNVAWIGYRSDHQMKKILKGDADSDIAYEVGPVDWSFVIFFCVELTLRFVAEGLHGFCLGRNRGINLYDALVVTSTCLNLTRILELNTSVLRVLRCFKAFATLRIFRRLQGLSDLYMLITNLVCCIRVMFWVLVFVMCVLFLSAVVSLDTIMHFADTSDENTRIFLDTYYPSLGRSMVTVMEVMSSGLPWGVYEANNLPIVRNVGLFVILLVNYCILPIIVSTCVYLSLNFQSSNSSARIHASQTEKLLFEKDLRERCEKVGVTQQELIDEDRLAAVLKKKRIQVFMTAHNIEMNAKDVFDMFDYDEQGSIDLERFVRASFWLKKSSHATDSLYQTQFLDYISDRIFENKTCIKSVGRQYSQALERIAGRAKPVEQEEGLTEDPSMPLIVSMERHVAFLLHEVERLNEQIKASRQDTVILGQLVTIGGSVPQQAPPPSTLAMPQSSPATGMGGPLSGSTPGAPPEKALAFDMLANRSRVQV
jgi:hypothetical protein